ncbi:MAG: urea transport system permease protein [Oceanicoccus sp.]|jgi:urea transport system permease protein
MKDFLRVLASLSLILASLYAPSVHAKEIGFDEAVNLLSSAKKMKEKETIIFEIAKTSDERKTNILKSLQDGSLYYQKSNKKVVLVQKKESGYLISDALTRVDYGIVEKRKIRKINISNKLRNQLKVIMAKIRLTDERPALRLLAVKDLINNLETKNLQIIDEALSTEKNYEIKENLQLASALIRLSSENEADRLLAIYDLKDTLHKKVIASLLALQEKDSEGSYLEPSDKVREAARNVVASMQGSEQFYKFLENLFFGVSLGSVLLLAAVGLAITFGVMGVINMAHGEMIMLGAYTTYVIQQIMPNYIEVSLLVAIPAAFMVSGLMGVLIERTVIRHLYGRPLETLLATFGISLVLQQLVRTIFSPLNKSVISPEWLSGSMEINGLLSLTNNRVYIIIFSFIVLLGLLFLLKKTFIGLQMRAVTQNRAMANSMGIRAGWVDALTFGLGSGIAGIAGVALSQLTNVGPNLGQAYIIDSFMVVVFGGVGNLFGTFFAAMSLGIANKFIEPVAGAVLGKIIVLVFIVLFIQWRPRGLFAIKGRFVED